MSDLTPNLLEVLREINNQPIHDPRLITVGELLVALRNFRVLAHEADRARLEDPSNRGEFESLHATLALNAREMTQRMVCAFFEKASNLILGHGAQLYAYAVMESYRLEVELVMNILKLGGDYRASSLGAHLA